MGVVEGMQRWVPDPPSDNQATLLRWPRWRLLLDDPSPRSVLVLGEADPGVEQWLAAISAQVRWIGTGRGLSRPVDLVVVGSDAERTWADRDTLRWLARCGAEGGALWIPGERTHRRERALVSAGFTRRRWMSAGHRGRARSPSVTTTGVVASIATPTATSTPPPTWLADVGRSAGWDADTGTWTLTTPGAYPSQKAVAVLRPGPRGGGAAVVKLAQDPRFDGRVRNESRALRALAAEAPAFAAARAPGVIADTQVGGTAAVVEQALLGRPFLEVSRLSPTCPLAADAADAITDLARETLTTTTGADLGRALADLCDRFVAAHRPPATVAAALAQQVDRVAARGPIPAVAVHGDLGTWNLLVVDDRVRILDWESAAGTGPPLWDLAYLARSYAVRTGRRHGLRRERAITRHLVSGSALTPVLAGWFRRYREATGLDAELVEALFHTCWMHRAVKESARLAPGAPGHYGPLCTYLVLQRSAPGLRQLLGT